jgi:hypothetical protein
MDLHPEDKILVVHDRGVLAKVLEAKVIACFSNPDGVEGDWFNIRTGTFGTALRTRDEGVTWSRDTSDAGRESLLAAFVLERSA